MTSKTGNANQTPFPESKKETSAKKSPENSSVVKKLCLFHKTKTHALNECQKFRELSLDNRRAFFKKNKLCFKCMASDKHFAENCDQNPPQCDICQKKHLTAMHNETKPSDSENTSTACTQVCGREESGRSCARFVLVKVSHQWNPNLELNTYAVLDDQSTDVFISDAFLKKLEVDAPELDLQVNTIVGSNTIRIRKVTGVYLQDIEHGYGPIKLPCAYTREFIPASHEDIATPHVASQWNLFQQHLDRGAQFSEAGLNGALFNINLYTNNILQNTKFQITKVLT